LSHTNYHFVKHRLLHKDGSYRVIVADGRLYRNPDGSPLLFRGSHFDITEQEEAVARAQKLEREFFQAQRLESIGQLAGGVAHDFNNIIQVILSCTRKTLNTLDNNDPNFDELKAISEACNRARYLTRQLLSFGRRQQISIQPVNLCRSLEGFLPLIQRVIPDNIVVNLDIYSSDLHILGDLIAIEHALLNLCVNSRDAMPEGGAIEISIGEMETDEKFLSKWPEASVGSFVTVSVRDTGHGMTEEELAKAFEPFYTTKEVDRGTGLGLASVHGIAEQHKGFITLESEPNRGTVATLYFPKQEAPLKEAKKSPTKAKTTKSSIGETILLADDYEMIRNITRSILEQNGYTVISAKDGEEATRLYNEQHDEVKLLLLDIMMPGKTGHEVVQEARKKNPDIRALLISGYDASSLDKTRVVDPEIPIITKPFEPEYLLQKISETLTS